MPEEKTGVEEATVDSNSSIEEIVDYASKQELEPDEVSPDSETSETDATAEVVKTETPEEGTEEESVDEGKPIPYTRFKEVNEKMKEYKSKVEKMETDLSSVQDLMQDAEVLKLAMQRRGYDDKSISKILKERGMMLEEAESQYDLNTTEGWKKFIADEIAKNVSPIKSTLEQKEEAERKAKTDSWVKDQETQARAIAKDTFGIEFGIPGKDESNINTGVGKIAKYLAENPDDAGLGHVKLLKLAMSGTAMQKAEAKGVQAEKARQEKLKSVAMEGDAVVTKDDIPQASWSIERILDWREKHPNAKI